MNASWMLSSIMVSMLIGAAALCAERVFMLRRGTPVRWVWVTAIALSIGWSGKWLLPSPAIPDAAQSVPSLSPALPHNVVIPGEAGEATQSPRADVPPSRWTALLATVRVPQLSEQTERRLQLASLVMSVALLLALAWSNTRLMRERRRWRATSLLNTDVLVSDGFGPAIVGMRRPAIVVPPWVLAVDTSVQRTILLHENEHRRAGDQWLLLASFGAVVLAPWNVVIWLMRRRLARTVELDCDERVLAHGVADVDYANVLLSAWQFARGTMPWVPSPALAEHVSRLGRRVEHLMRPTPRRRIMKTIGGMFTSVLLIGAAVFVPAPQQAQSRPFPAPQPAQMPSVPTPRAAPTPSPSPSVPTPQRERSPSVPAPVAAPMPSVPAPVATPTPSILTPAPSPPVPTPVGVQNPSMPTPAPTTADGTTQKAARLLVIMPWDSTAASLARAIHERLAEDLRGKTVHVIPHAEFVQYASASGFSSNTLLTPTDVKALRSLTRADLVVALFEVRPLDGGFRVYASVVGTEDGAALRILDGEGSVTGISNSLIRALQANPAYLRLKQSQTDATNGVDRSAVVVPGTVAPAYPAEMLSLGLSGDVVARFVVDTNGRVDESTIAILASDRPQFSVGVIEWLRSAQFLAAQRNAVKVRQQLQWPFQFRSDRTRTTVLMPSDDTTAPKILLRFKLAARTKQLTDTLRFLSQQLTAMRPPR